MFGFREIVHDKNKTMKSYYLTLALAKEYEQYNKFKKIYIILKYSL